MKDEHEAPQKLLSYLYPLRPDCTAFIQVPRDLTPKEANRLCAMLRTLPMDSGAAEEVG